LHSFTQLNTYQTDPAAPTGPNDQEHSLGQQGNDSCTTEFNVQHLKALLVSNRGLMHFKINITENHANFLQHIFGSKTSLKNQQTHLKLL
jgi:hypothetical protein